eukprot:967743-Ditylum_brightwellii.AAC.1
MQDFLQTFGHQAVRCGWLQTDSKVGIHKMSDTRQMNLKIGFGWAESVCNQSQYYSGVPTEKSSDGGMMHPCITHLSHKVGFKFLELPLPLLKEVLNVAEAVNPGIKKILKQYMGILVIEGGIEPANQAHIEVTEAIVSQLDYSRPY